MRLYTAPEYVPDEVGFDEPIVFLAGSIEQGAARNWQALAIDALHDTNAIVFNPRRAVWDASWVQSTENPEFLAQVNCELDHLEYCDIAFFYIQAGTMSPITLAELGKMLELYKTTDVAVVVVCEPGFWRRGNVEIMCKRVGVETHESLEDGIEQLLYLVQPE